MVGLSGIEPLTSRLSGARSNHLSYRPTNPRCPEGHQEPALSPARPSSREKRRIAHESEVAKGSTDLGIEQTKARLPARQAWRSDAHELFDTP